MNQDSLEIPETEKVDKKIKPARRKSNIWRSLLPALVVLLLMSASAAGAFFWQQAIINSNNIEAQSLRERVDSLEAQLEKPNASDGINKADSSTKVVPDSQTSDNVKAAIETGNTAALLDVFAPSVNYAIAASEAQGVHTPAQAVSDLDYIESASATWNFDLPQSELSEYRASIYYGKYFPEQNVMVGKSSDGKLVSFIFNSDNKITTLFMSIDSNIVKD